MSEIPSQRTRPCLFSKYEGLERKISWISLGNMPTPVQRLDNLSKHTSAEIWVKRDDLTSPVYGGNKVRKLEFVLADALAKRKKTIVTMGGIGTNHGLAVTIFGKQLGLNTALKLMEQPVNEHVLENLRLFAAYGAHMQYCGGMARIAWEYGVASSWRHPGAYRVPAGGSSSLGELRYVDAGLEIAQAIENKEFPVPEKIFVAAGTCGTMAGLALGLALAEIPTTVVGVCVTPPFIANRKVTLKLAGKALNLMRRYDPAIPDVSLASERVIMDENYYGGGYGQETDECREAVSLIKDTEGLVLETTYTGKALAALLDCAKQAKGPILFLNTFSSANLSEKAADVTPDAFPKNIARLFP